MGYFIITDSNWTRLRNEILSLAETCHKAFGEQSRHTDWLHNGDVCRLLNISKRTLQHYRDTGVLPFSQIGHKCYSKREDVDRLLETKSVKSNTHKSKSNKYDKRTMEQVRDLNMEADDMQVVLSAISGVSKRIKEVAQTHKPLFGGEHFLTGKEVCERLYISPRTLQDYRDKRIIPYTQFAGKILYKASDLEKMLEGNYKR